MSISFVQYENQIKMLIKKYDVKLKTATNSMSSAKRRSTPSVSSDSSVDLARVSNARRSAESSSMSWIVPVLLLCGSFLVIYLIYCYSCSCAIGKDMDNSNSNSNRNSNNNRGVIVIDSMANKGVVQAIDGVTAEAKHNQQPIVIGFVAPGCGHCKNMMPHLHRAAEKSPMIIHTIEPNAKNGMEFAKRFNVRGYPTLLVIYKGKIISEYTGNRTADDILRWISSNSDRK